MNLLIVVIAVYGLVTADNMIRKVMCLAIIESIVILTFLRTGFAEERIAPILEQGVAVGYVDPMPQALMLTAIVIGVCFKALAVVFIVKVYETYGTVLVSEIHER